MNHMSRAKKVNIKQGGGGNKRRNTNETQDSDINEP